MEKKLFKIIAGFNIFTILATSLIILGFTLGSDSLMSTYLLFMPIIIGIIILSLILLYLSIGLITKNVLGPIINLSQNIESITTKKVSKEKSYKELAPLVDLIKIQKEEIDNYVRQLESMDEYRRNFTSNITHELKTPLTSIRGYGELISSGLVDPDDIEKFGNIIIEQSDILSGMVDSILTLSKIEAREVSIETFNISEVLKKVYYSHRHLAMQRDIELQLDIEDFNISGDKKMIEYLFSNLVSNAIKYNDKFGTVSIRAYPQDYMGYVHIIDNGYGMDENQLDKIFQRFYTLESSRNKDKSGTGIGLAIVKHAVDVHRGTIEVKSDAGLGTEFIIGLPLETIEN